jgi:hypothetical protein
MRRECGGLHAEQTSIYDVIERGAQPAMVVIFERDEAKWLQNGARHLPRGAENFGHAMHRACLRLKGDFDKVTLTERLSQLQQAASHGNGLEFRFCAPAVFESDGSQD